MMRTKQTGIELDMDKPAEILRRPEAKQFNDR